MKSLDGKTFFASLIVVGFLVLTGLSLFYSIPADNVKTVDGAMTALGTALGAAVMALLRNSKADETKAENTGAAFRAIEAAANSTPGPDHSQAIQDGDSVTMTRDEA